jgi:hypothetical protein
MMKGGVVMNEERCVVCGEPISEGRMVCHTCEAVEPSFDTVKIKVLLDKIADIKDFVNLATKCKDDIVVKTGYYSVNAKSIMGLFSLDLTKPLTVEFYGDIPYEVRNGMKKFIID